MARSLGSPPWGYRPGNTLLHRLPGGLKMVLVPAFSGAPFLFGLPALVPLGLLLAAGAMSAGIRPGELLRGSRPLGVMILLTGLCRSLDFSPREFPYLVFNREGFAGALLFAGTVLISFGAGALLFSVTTMTELRDSLEKAEGLPLRLLWRLRPAGRFPGRFRRPGRSKLCLGITLMLGFLPRFFEIWETVNLAYQARGGKGGIPRILILLPLVTERMMEIAAETAGALESRGLEF